MTSHYLDTHPPDFKFEAVSSHEDVLSEQITEAVLIREQGNLNQKLEFSKNELIRVRSGRLSTPGKRRSRKGNYRRRRGG